jgi:hypothetical protein
MGQTLRLLVVTVLWKFTIDISIRIKIIRRFFHNKILFTNFKALFIPTLYHHNSALSNIYVLYKN